MLWTVFLVLAGFAAQDRCADETAKASATLDGKKLKFPEKGVESGVKTTIALLETCSSKSEGTSDDLKKSKEGDHVRLVFTKPVTVTVSGDKLEVAELVLTQPLNTGVFWLRCGDMVVRCTKYRFEKEKDFVEWRKEATVSK